jgi:hypothetical protein
MYNAPLPTEDELPSAARLLRSTAIAAGVALVLLFTVLLPSEYAVDPTRIGRVLGLTQMGEIKLQLAAEAEAETSRTATLGASSGGWRRSRNRCAGWSRLSRWRRGRGRRPRRRRRRKRLPRRPPGRSPPPPRRASSSRRRAPTRRGSR